MAKSDFNWTDDAIARLQDLWAKGISMAQIGRQLGTSKNAVVGKVHRLNLPPRPSPIRTATGHTASEVAQRGAATRRGRRSPACRDVTPAQMPRGAAPVAYARARVATSTLAAATMPARSSRVLPAAGPSPHKTCRWIDGQAAGAATRFCDAPSLRGRSWCAEHAARCFTLRPTWAA